MKRLFFACVACAALAVPSVAAGSPAGSVSAHAKRGDEFLISFDFTRKKVKHLAFENAVGTCEVNGPVNFNGTEFGPYRINKKGKWGGKTPVHWSKRGEVNGSVAVHGDFNRKRTKVEGTFRAKGDVGSNTGCDTGKIEWGGKIVN
jgi:formylmethanofuran dehydrogenase subunit C